MRVNINKIMNGYSIKINENGYEVEFSGLKEDVLTQFNDYMKASLDMIGLKEELDDDDVEFHDIDGNPIKIGDKVIWFDPEYVHRDLTRIYVVYDIKGDFVYIADRYSEVEVFPIEIKVVS